MRIGPTITDLRLPRRLRQGDIQLLLLLLVVGAVEVEVGEEGADSFVRDRIISDRGLLLRRLVGGTWGIPVVMKSGTRAQ